MSKSRQLFIAVVIVTGAAAMALIRVPFAASAYGRIVPASEWTLERGNNGQLIATLRNNIRGTCDAYDVSSPSGDAKIRFVINSDVLRRGHIRMGDTLGHLYLSDVEERLIELQGDLEVAKAALAVDRSGEKEALVLEAARELELAEAESDLQDKIVARISALHARNLVSIQEYEIAEGKAELLKLEARVALARLEAVKTGAKPQQIGLLRVQITALESEVNTVQARLTSSAIVSPLTGRVSGNFSADTLLIVSDTTACAALVPVKLDIYQYILGSREIDIRLNRVGLTTKAHLVGWSQTIHIVGGEQTVMASARITGRPANIWSGMVVTCDFPCASVTILEYLRRLLESAAG